MSQPTAGDAIAVLASGGADSAVLVADLLRRGRAVHPIHVRFGLAWEVAEEAHLRRFLGTLTDPAPEPLVVVDVPIAPIYGSHWSVSGHDVPDDDTPDDAVYLPGRNLLLLALPSVWCQLNGVHQIALGTLKGNPFPDATDAFFTGFSRLVERGMDHAARGAHALLGAVQGRCPGAGTRIGAGAHVLLHRSRRRPPLRTVQQVCRATTRVRLVLHRRSDRLRLVVSARAARPTSRRCRSASAISWCRCPRCRR